MRIFKDIRYKVGVRLFHGSGIEFQCIGTITFLHINLFQFRPWKSEQRIGQLKEIAEVLVNTAPPTKTRKGNQDLDRRFGESVDIKLCKMEWRQCNHRIEYYFCNSLPLETALHSHIPSNHSVHKYPHCQHDCSFGFSGSLTLDFCGELLGETTSCVTTKLSTFIISHNFDSAHLAHCDLC